MLSGLIFIKEYKKAIEEKDVNKQKKIELDCLKLGIDKCTLMNLAKEV